MSNFDEVYIITYKDNNKSNYIILHCTMYIVVTSQSSDDYNSWKCVIKMKFWTSYGSKQQLHYFLWSELDGGGLTNTTSGEGLRVSISSATSLGTGPDVVTA